MGPPGQIGPIGQRYLYNTFVPLPTIPLILHCPISPICPICIITEVVQKCLN